MSYWGNDYIMIRKCDVNQIHIMLLCYIVTSSNNTLMKDGPRMKRKETLILTEQLEGGERTFLSPKQFKQSFWHLSLSFSLNAPNVAQLRYRRSNDVTIS